MKYTLCKNCSVKQFSMHLLFRYIVYISLNIDFFVYCNENQEIMYIAFFCRFKMPQFWSISSLYYTYSVKNERCIGVCLLLIIYMTLIERLKLSKTQTVWYSSFPNPSLKLGIEFEKLKFGAFLLENYPRFALKDIRIEFHRDCQYY